MSTPKVYVYCDQNCKREGMTKEQILAAITQAVETHAIADVDTGFVTTLKTVNGTYIQLFLGTQAEWQAFPNDQKTNVFAVITDDTMGTDLLSDVAALQQAVADILDGDLYVKNSINATRATNSENIKAFDGTFKTLAAALLEMVYPVGSIKMTSANINPSTYLGGTWVLYKSASGSGSEEVGGTTGTYMSPYGGYLASGTVNLGKGLTNVTIKEGTNVASAEVSYDTSTGIASWALYANAESINVSGTINYQITEYTYRRI